MISSSVVWIHFSEGTARWGVFGGGGGRYHCCSGDACRSRCRSSRGSGGRGVGRKGLEGQPTSSSCLVSFGVYFHTFLCKWFLSGGTTNAMAVCGAVAHEAAHGFPSHNLNHCGGRDFALVLPFVCGRSPRRPRRGREGARRCPTRGTWTGGRESRRDSPSGSSR